MSRVPSPMFNPKTGATARFVRRPNGDVECPVYNEAGKLIDFGVMSLADAKRCAADDRKNGWKTGSPKP